ncbi:peptidyl-prolyl cis-trans isomerase-like 6 [Schistosoma bovis]|uniref:Peptidyl-prolyl cis-trans isomerase n=1 Tax=Schistosoma bovis TaxID=6184 RepID=A0A430QIA0_SCHBO|nr:peptidyl-prolyl cis-trans isomerase-like 6 [Schistosoma bovis]
MVIEIYGLVHKESFQKASLLASKLGGAYWIYNHDVLVIIDGVPLGSEEDLANWAEREFNITDYRPMTLYSALAVDAYQKRLLHFNHDRRGILSMANSGRHTNGSQFLITLAPAEWMDNRYVAFGRVIEGSLTLDKMEEVQTHYERPVKDICIENISVVNPNELATKIA